ncbi:MAG: LytTR family transcriptional regulator DNA-binding domain-containing protein [Saprospiraceae bacterium]|nr:LytTR family transcriptional regulator DNA-binding domain-containing protein [Saprospiraceae bacterium]
MEPQISLNENRSLESREIFIKFKSDADYSEIVIPGKKYLSFESLRDWLHQSGPSQFVRIHKSYIINIRKTERMAGNQIYLQGDIVIPIGRTFKDDFMKRFISRNHQ